MSKNKRYQYYVEGECEKKLIEILKRNNMILPGNVSVFNVIQNKFSNSRLANLSSHTVVVLVFDTDSDTDATLKENLWILQKYSTVREIWCIPQVKNLEDELLRSTDVHQIKDLIGCQSKSDFKREWLNDKRLFEKLKQHSFNYARFWSLDAEAPFASISNDANKVKNQGI